jgi:endoribonuclease Dicer
LREDQPVVEAELLPIRRNLLDDNVGDEDLEPKPCFLVLEPLRISPVSLVEL